MILKLYTIRDSKALVYNAPFAQKTHGEAERSFKELSRDPQSMISKYPKDYDLYYLGDFDDNTGKIIPQDAPQHVASAIDNEDKTLKKETVLRKAEINA